MNDEELVEAIRAAGRTPPPPDRAGALMRALAATPARRRARTIVIGLVAAAIVAVPVGVLAARGVRQVLAPKPPAVSTMHRAKPSPSPGAEPNGEKSETRQTETPDRSGGDGATANVEETSGRDQSGGGSPDGSLRDGSPDGSSFTDGSRSSGGGEPAPGDGWSPNSGPTGD